MKSLSIARPKEGIHEAITAVRSIEPSLVFLFAAPSIINDQAAMAEVQKGLQGIPSIGCSTAGEITQDGLHENALVLLGVHFDHSTVRCVKAQMSTPQETAKAATEIAESLRGSGLRAVFVYAGGVTSNASVLVQTLYECLPHDVLISGGMAGDETAFKKTSTYIDGIVYDDQIVAVGLYGDMLEVSSSSEGGWRTFGPARRVTKSNENVLYELDNKPVLQLYDAYIGANDQGADRLAYPLAILRDDRSNAGIIRAPLAVDRAANAMIMAGDLPQGSLVCMMHANNDSLIQGAAQAAAEAIRTHPSRHQDGFALLFSCVARRLVMTIDTDDEIEAVRDSFDDGTTLAGFYTYGEIGPLPKSMKPELHNQTMTITYVTERKA